MIIDNRSQSNNNDRQITQITEVVVGRNPSHTVMYNISGIF